jgi:hypothetical protein
MLLRMRVNSWLARPRPWTRVVLINSMIMTMFLWHLTALVLAILVLHPLGFGLEATTSLRWWLERPLWLLAPAVFLTPLLLVFSRWERPLRRRPAPDG